MIVRISGGLGNQMFQYAFFRSLKDRFPKSEILLDKSFYSEKNIHNGFELSRLFGIKDEVCDLYPHVFNKSKIQTFVVRCLKKMPYPLIKFKNIVIENGVYYFPNIMDDVSEYTIFDGYWQSEEYFTNIKNELIREFIFPEDNNSKNIELKDFLLNINSISLHVRRGDYLNSSRYDNLGDSNYYRKAMSRIEELVKLPYYIVFSDDIEWCKQNLFTNSNNALFVDWNKGRDSFRDMQLMSCCKHNIIANSSFSWWGAWLNQNSNKIVIAPNKFFRDCNYDESHLLPSSWIRISN